MILGAIIVIHVVTHLYRLSDGPNGFHRWRETDTSVVAANFFNETSNLFSPRIDARNQSDGRIGMELPVYSYVVGGLWALFGENHAWARGFTLVGSVLFLLALYRLVIQLSRDRQWALMVVLAAAMSPLFFFYSRKIQPDIWALTLTTWGCVWTVDLVRRYSARSLVVAGFCFALAAMMKPTFLACGLMVVAYIYRSSGLAGFRRPWIWGILATTLVPMILWFDHARSTNAAINSNYFYLGGEWAVVWNGLTSWSFYQNIFLTWFWELGIGAAFAMFFVWGLVRGQSQWRWLWGPWALGCLIVFVATAGHCATPHDYYFLPAIPVLAMITGLGLKLAWEGGGWGRKIAILCIVVSPCAAYLRVSQRYGTPYEFGADRVFADEHLPSQENIVTIDPIPSGVLYQLGRKGWRLPPQANLSHFLNARKSGIRYLAVDTRTLSSVSHYQTYLDGPVAQNERVQIFQIKN